MKPLMEMFIDTLVKSIDVPKLLENPKVDAALKMLRDLRDDFAEIKNTNREILARLDKLENKTEDHPPNNSVIPIERKGFFR